MKKYILKLFLTLLVLTIFVSCEKSLSDDEPVIAQKITPGSDSEQSSTKTDSTIEATEFQNFSPQIIIDRNYSIYEIRDINIDEDEWDEQIILAGPLNDDKEVFKLFIADYDNRTSEYVEIYKGNISTNNLNIASIASEDITGDHINEVIITGIDTKDFQIYEVYKMINIKNSEEYSFAKVFSQRIDGDFELIKSTRGNDYKINKLKGESFTIEVRKKNPESETNIIEEKYKWNEETSIFELNSSLKVKISSASNEKLMTFYNGSSQDYLNFLSGPWFKVKDLNGNITHNMSEIFQIQTNDQSMTFFSDDKQETFTWADNKKPIKYRNVLSFYDVRNNYQKSMSFSISIYIDSFESIRVKIRGNQRWGGTYTQLTENLQNVLTDKSKENSLLSEMEIKGLYKTNLNTEVIFDSPEYILKEDSIESKGIYTIFSLGEDQILEMKELSSNGLTVKIKSYKMDYNETSDDLRVIRTITLQKGNLTSGGIVQESNSELHFEQIEKIDQDVTDNQL